MATFQRAALAVKRTLFARGMVVFCCDLVEGKSSIPDPPNGIVIDRISSLGELGVGRRQMITGFWNRKLANRNMEERFARAATLWTVDCDGQLAGFGWTLQGGTIEPYYFPLLQEDVHLFDFHVFPGYRGRGINPLLVSHILGSLTEDGVHRAFIEAAEWNEAQLASLRKTAFRHLGTASSYMVLRRRFTTWEKVPKPITSHQIGKSSVRAHTSAR